jgi:hypothetical protein
VEVEERFFLHGVHMDGTRFAEGDWADRPFHIHADAARTVFANLNGASSGAEVTYFHNTPPGKFVF